MIAAEQASLKVSEDTNLEQPDVNLSPDNRENQEGETTVATSEPAPIKEALPEKTRKPAEYRGKTFIYFSTRNRKAR